MSISGYACLFATGKKNRKVKIIVYKFPLVFAFGKNEFKTPSTALETGPGTNRESGIDMYTALRKIDS